jgi:hypothetical protein
LGPEASRAGGDGSRQDGRTDELRAAQSAEAERANGHAARGAGQRRRRARATETRGQRRANGIDPTSVG